MKPQPQKRHPMYTKVLPVLSIMIASQFANHAAFSSPQVYNPGFELPNERSAWNYINGSGDQGNPPSDQSLWIFNGPAGAAANGSALNVFGAPGDQSGFLQRNSRISQIGRD